MVRQRVALQGDSPNLLMVQAKRTDHKPVFEAPPQQSDYVSIWDAHEAAPEPAPAKSVLLGARRHLPPRVRNQVVQPVLLWLRWDGIGEDARAAVRDPRAFLVRIVTRKALDRLRSNARRREEYVGEWLPEPLLTAPDVADDVELAESVSIAMLTVLETLTPTERAVFVLREVFDTPYGEIADVVGKSAAAVRQIGHRAR